MPQGSVVKMHTQDFVPDMAHSNYLMQGDYLTLPLTANLPNLRGKETLSHPGKESMHEYDIENNTFSKIAL